MKAAERQPETISLVVYGGVYFKTFVVPDADTLIPQHSHRYDHLTAILQGLVRVWRDDEWVGDFLAPGTVRIPAHCKHRFLTLTPGVVLACVHREDTADAVAEEHHLVTED